MSAAATLLATWCAVYAFAATYYTALWARARRQDPEHLTYACTCFALAIWAAGAVLLREARTLEEGTLAVRLQYVGGFAGIAFFVDFVSHLGGTPRRSIVHASYVACGIGLLLDLAGGLVDPARSALDVALGDGGRYSAVEPALRPLGLVAIGIAVALSLLAAGALARVARTDVDARIVLIGTSIPVLAGAHDTIVRVAGLDAPYLLEHAGLSAIVAVGYVLLRRVVRSARRLERRTQELRRSYDELRVTQEELVRKEQLAAVGELSAVIAHEVRNPLAVLKNAVSSLRRPTLTSADRGVLLGILDEETDRLNRLVRDLLAYARPVAPKGTVVDLEGLVVRAFDIARGGRDLEPEIQLHLELDAGPRAVRGDPELLRHALVNVIDNALQAMPAGGSLRVTGASTSLDGKPACALSFRDTGEGMDTLVRSKALDPFFTTRPAGTGLGLAIVDRVVKNHGGRLAIESDPGAGTSVTLTLPCAEDR